MNGEALNGVSVPSGSNHNPVVATAKKKIGPVKRAGIWVREHQRTIFLTLEGLGALAVQYWYFKRKLMAAQRKFDSMTVQASKDAAKAVGATAELANMAVDEAVRAQKQQVDQVARQRLIEGRIKALEDTLRDPKFHKYLKDKHGITGLKGFKK